MNYALIMAGGGGTRLWPRCRQWAPKQLWAVHGGNSLLQSTFNRVNQLIPAEQIIVATAVEFGQAVRQQLPDIPEENFIFEPVSRDTGPAIALASQFLRSKDPQGNLVILPADHLVEDESSWTIHLRLALEAAEQTESIITLGIHPSRPETAYGYIQCADKLYTKNGIALHTVRKFREKPDAIKAKEYLESGNYFWNSGIYVASLATLAKIFYRHQAEMLQMVEEILYQQKILRLDMVGEGYMKLPKISFDYCVMEKETNILVIPGSFGWDDVGSWSALERALPKDADGNVCLGVSVPYRKLKLHRQY